jgi:hypothetical protein
MIVKVVLQLLYYDWKNKLHKLDFQSNDVIHL